MLLTQRRTTPRDPNKFPATQLFLLALVRVAEPIALTSIFPYAWKLVLHFHVGAKSDASFYSGLLISAFALAESITGMYWGGLSDRLGRKPVLIMGCLGTIASLLVVGFSTNFWIALFGRFLGGALNGNIGVIQTMVGELVVNPKHEPKAYAVMPFVWSIGTILGPSIGGYFAAPAQNFPDAFAEDGLFGKFPYLLPNLICAGLMAISIVAGYFCLEETHPDIQPWSQDGDDGAQYVQHAQHFRTESAVMTTQATDTLPAVNLRDESYGTFNDVSEEAIEEEEWNVKPDGTSRSPSLSSGSNEKVFTKRVVALIVALGIFTYHAMTFENLLPIFFQDERVPVGGREVINILANQYDPFAGGLDLSMKDVGIISSLNGVIALFVQGIVFPIMTSWLGVWKTFILVTILHPIAYFIMPFLAFVPTNMLYPMIYLFLVFRNCMSILSYPVLLILIKEASPGPSCLGKINGLAASTGAACRTIASPVAGLLYGVGIKIHFTPIAWWASSLVALIGSVQVLTIKRESGGPHHQVRSVFMPESEEQHQHQIRHRPSVVRIRVQNDSGYASEDEQTPLVRPRQNA